jgi:hypothetical protein
VNDLRNVVLSVRFSSATEAERWFKLICRLYKDFGFPGEISWDRYRDLLMSTAVSEGFPAEAPNQFARYLESAGNPLKILANMHQQGEAILCRMYAEGMATAGSGEETGVPAGGIGSTEGYGESAAAETRATEDLGAWNSYLATNGPRWNGSEEAWPQFCEWFLYYAAEAGVGESAAGFIAYLDTRQDKIAVFGQYGVWIPAPAEELVVATDRLAASADDPGGSADAEGVSSDAGMTAEDAMAEIAGPSLTEFRRSYPQFGRLSDAEVKQLIKEVIAESKK